MDLEASRKAKPALTDETLLDWVGSLKVLLSTGRSIDWYITEGDLVVAKIPDSSLCGLTL